MMPLFYKLMLYIYIYIYIYEVGNQCISCFNNHLLYYYYYLELIHFFWGDLFKVEDKAPSILLGSLR